MNMDPATSAPAAVAAPASSRSSPRMSRARLQSLLRAMKGNRPTCPRVVDLSWTNLGSDLGMVADALRTNHTVSELVLVDCKIGDDDAKAIANALVENEHLTTLNLSGNEIGSEGGAALAASLATNSTLTRLSLLGNGIADDVTHLITKLVESNKVSSCPEDAKRRKAAVWGQQAALLERSRKVQSGDKEKRERSVKFLYSDQEDSVEVVQVPLFGISNAEGSNEGPKSPSRSPRSEFWERMAESSDQSLSPSPSQESGESSFDRTLRRMVDNDPTLVEVHLSHQKLGDVGCTMLAEALRVNTIVTAITLRGNSISGVGATALAHSLVYINSLAVLDLADNAIGDVGTIALAHSLSENTSLMDLNLSFNGVGNQGGLAIVDALRVNGTIRHLNLSGNLLSGELMQMIMQGVAMNYKSSNNRRGRKRSGSASSTERRVPQCRLAESELDRTVRRMKERDPSLLEIDLCWKMIGNRGLARVARGLRDNDTVRTVSLSGNNIGAKGIKSLAEALQHNTAIIHLELSENDVGDEGARTLAKSLQENKSLKTLILEEANICDEGAKALSSLLCVNSVLTVLVLSQNMIGNDGAACLAEDLCQNKVLRALDLTHNNLTNDGAGALVDALRVNGTMTTLCLEDNSIEDDLCAMVGRLLEINMEAKSALEAAHIKNDEFDHRVGWPRSTELDVLIQRIAENDESAVDIDLSWKHVGDAGALLLANALQTNSTAATVDLSGNEMGADGAKAIAGALCCNETVEKLDLCDNNIESAGAICLSEALLQNDVLSTLDVSNNNGLGDAAARAFSHALRYNKALRRLDLTNSGVGDEGAIALAEAIRTNSTLTTLVLYKNRIGDDAGRAFADALNQNNAMTKLNLENNRLSDELIDLINKRMDMNKTVSDMAVSADQPKVTSTHAQILVDADDVDEGRQIMKRLTAAHSDPAPVPPGYLQDCTDNFSESRRLGEGAYGEVFLGIDKVLRRKFAIKRIRLRILADADIDQAKKTFQRELATLTHFCHPNVARMFAYSFSEDVLRGNQYLVFELAANGSLDRFLNDSREKEKLHWATRVNVALDVARALEFLHEGRAGQKCFHRDIKASNICLKRDYTALLIDCGVAKMIPHDESKLTLTLMETGNRQWTPGYVCPIFASSMRSYSSACDVFSLGIVYLELLTGMVQYSKIGEETVDLFARYGVDGAGKSTCKLKSDADTSAGIWSEQVLNEFSALSLECISLVPANRPTMHEIVSRLEKLASLGKPWSFGERNHITVLTSSPLVWMDTEGKHHPFPGALNFEHERNLLSQCMYEAKRHIRLSFDVATDDRLQAATTRCGCLHFSGHGYPTYLVLEDGCTGGAHFLDKLSLQKIVSVQPFKFVFVSACYSGLMGSALVEAGVPHVVCCNADSELRDDAAIKFTYSFYLALAEGYTVKAAYDRGRLAVSNQFNHEEVDKFKLLPEDGDHDEPLFDADTLALDEEKENSGFKQFIPEPPEHFLGREVVMFKLLKVVLSKRLVTVTGTNGVGCSSLASAICHYIRERHTTMLAIDAIYFVRRANETKGEPIEMFIKPLYDQLSNEGKAPAISHWFDPCDLFSKIFHSLKGTKALVIFDGLLSEDHDVMKAFIEGLFLKTNKMRVLLTARTPTHLLSYNVIEHVFRLKPLDLQNAGRLFAKFCTHIDTLDRRREFLAAVDSDKVPVEDIFESLGGGVPRRTIEAAVSISSDAFDKMMVKLATPA